MDHKIVHFEIPADDVEALAGFYRELFGWKIEPAEGFEGYWSVIPAPGEKDSLMGGMMKRQQPGQKILDYVMVEDVAAYAAKAKELGATVLVDKMEIPKVGWFAVLDDPQGNCLGIFEANPEMMAKMEEKA